MSKIVVALLAIAAAGAVGVWGYQHVRITQGPQDNPAAAVPPPASRPGQLGDLPLLWDLKGHAQGVIDLAFSPDGRRLASAGADGTVRLWDVHAGTEMWHVQGHQAPVLRVAWSPDGKWIASGGEDGQAMVWDAQTGNNVGRVTCRSWVDALAFMPAAPDDPASTGRRLVVGEQQDAAVYDWNAGAEVQEIPTVSRVYSAALSPDGKVAALGAGQIELINGAGELVAEQGATPEEPGSPKDMVAAVAFSDPGRVVFSDWTGVGSWKLPGTSLEAGLNDPGQPIRMAAGANLVVAPRESEARAFEPGARLGTARWRLPAPCVTAAVSPAGDYVAVAGGGYWEGRQWRGVPQASVYVYGPQAVAQLLQAIAAAQDAFARNPPAHVATPPATPAAKNARSGT